MKIMRYGVIAVSLISLSGCVLDAVSNALPAKSVYGAENIGGPGTIITSSAQTVSANSLGVTGTVNTHDAEALFGSIDSMVGQLGQRDQLAFMEAFFRVAYFDRCDIVGEWGSSGNSFNGGRKPFFDCLSTARSSRWSKGAAEAYVANKRMDSNRAYVASNAFGSWTGGRTQRESYVNFINLYGDTIDGKSADYIMQRNKDIMSAKAVSFR